LFDDGNELVGSTVIDDEAIVDAETRAPPVSEVSRHPLCDLAVCVHQANALTGCPLDAKRTTRDLAAADGTGHEHPTGVRSADVGDIWPRASDAPILRIATILFARPASDKCAAAATSPADFSPWRSAQRLLEGDGMSRLRREQERRAEPQAPVFLPPHHRHHPHPLWERTRSDQNRLNGRRWGQGRQAAGGLPA
jgi:hypothetical protein